ncbi:MAG: hypothetical protein H6739_33480 [Alphaproteobacteria bacterium]|nr:hypothetical protein [Alphaproteobacteria bacterium]
MRWLALLLIAACTGSPEPPPPTPDGAPATGPVAGDTLVVALPFDPGNLNPLVAPYAMSGYFIDLTQPGLVLRAVTDAGLEYEPALAESWTWSEAGDALTYTLREGLTWNDNTPLTTADVAFTYALIADPAVASNWHDDSNYIDAIEIVDDRTVTFRFTGPGNPLLLQGYTIRGILPQHLLADADRATLRGHPYSRAPASSGPWQVSSWSAEEKLVLTPNPGSGVSERPPWLERIVARVIPEYATRLIELENGGIDYLLTVEVPDVPKLKRDHPRLALRVQPADGMWYAGWNTRDPVFSDPRVREAMTLAINPQQIIDDHYTVEGTAYARPCVGTIAPTLGDWFASDLKPLAPDPAAARARLAEAGWADADADGVLDRDGQPLTVSMMIQSGTPRVKKVAITLQAQLKAVGVDLQIRTLEPNLFSQRAREHDFQAILWAFGNNPKVDPYIQWHSKGQYNWMQLSDPEIDRLAEALKAATTLEEAQANAREIQRLVYAHHAATFLLWEDSISAIDGRFQDVETDTFNALRHAERWWVPAGQQKY